MSTLGKLKLEGVNAALDVVVENSRVVIYCNEAKLEEPFKQLVKILTDAGVRFSVHSSGVDLQTASLPHVSVVGT